MKRRKTGSQGILDSKFDCAEKYTAKDIHREMEHTYNHSTLEMEESKTALVYGASSRLT